MKKSKNNEILYNEARLGNLAGVKNCIKSRVDINSTDKWGWSALNVASFRGHTDVVKFLIREGAEVDQEDVSCYTALCRATQKGHKDIIKVLLKAGADVNHRNRRGNTPLSLASYWGHEKSVMILLMYGADIEVKNNVGVTALTLASTESEDIVKILIDVGADSRFIKNKELESKCSTEEKDQLFSKALRGEKYEIAIILLQRDEEVISKLVDQQILECLLHQAAKLEESEHILAMVKTSVDINAIDKDGNTALHKAADNTFGENVKILLELGADKNIKNKIGQLPLDVTTDENIKYLFSSSNSFGNNSVDNLGANIGEDDLPMSTDSQNIYYGLDPILKLNKDEAETWEASVTEADVATLKPKEAKYQEHIYEFIMTEKHHCQLLKKIQKLFFEEMKLQLDMKSEVLVKLFPELENLVDIHFDFLKQLRIQQVSY